MQIRAADQQCISGRRAVEDARANAEDRVGGILTRWERLEDQRAVRPGGWRAEPYGNAIQRRRAKPQHAVQPGHNLDCAGVSSVLATAVDCYRWPAVDTYPQHRATAQVDPRP